MILHHQFKELIHEHICRNKKKLKKLLAVVIVIAIFFFWYEAPFKVKDPNDPKFVETSFRLRDYNGGQNTIFLRDKVLPDLFQVGSSKEYVDLMLSTRGGARIQDKTHFIKGYYSYIYQPLYLIWTPNAWIFDAYYDENNKLKAMGFAYKQIVGKNFKPEIIKRK